jgi:threonine dehydrogenase-like Zn-dependent dehydrogenase
MRSLYFDRKLSYRDDYPQPRPAAGEALIRVRYAGLCNTDREIMSGYKGFTGILGHEFVGVVTEAEDPSWIGRRVVGDINLGCGTCDRCLAGVANHCTTRKVLGILGKDGVFADYITLPLANLHPVPAGVSDLAAVFSEPLAAALEVTEQCHVALSQRVAVLGDGKLGQLVAQVLSLTGCQLTVIGKHDDKLRLLARRAHTVTLDRIGGLPAFDLIVECSGRPEGLATAQALVKPRGRIILKSTYAGLATTDPTTWVVKEITLTGSRCGPLAAALRLLDRRLVDVEPLISGVWPLTEWREAFAHPGVKAVFDLSR